MDLVSVIIPTYQSDRTILDAIESVLHQTYPAVEVIVIDDGSTDRTQEVLKPFHNQIRYFWQENQGQAAARNHGIDHADGEFIAFLDADDLWVPDKLETQIPLFRDRDNLGAVFGNIYYFSGDQKQIRTSFDLYPPARGWVFKELFVQNFIPLSTAVIRKNIIDQIGVFQPQVTPVEDYEYWLRLSKFYEMDYIDKTVAGYRVQPLQSSANIQRIWGKFLSVQARVYQENREALKGLPLSILDRCFYNKYLKLALNSMEHLDLDQADRWLNAYQVTRPGVGPLYFPVRWLRQCPPWMQKWISRTIHKIKAKPALGRY